MKIAMIGSGYVGLVSAACFANIGNRVYCVDRDPKRIDNLENGQMPIYEPGLEALVRENTRQGTLSFHLASADVIDKVEIVFIAVGTPMGKDGAADLAAVYAVAREIGSHMSRPLIVVNKSTVPVGTGDQVRKIIAAELDRRGESLSFSMVSNPEFLKEGKAISDFGSPDRIVLGSDDPDALEVMGELYRPMVYRNPKERILRMSLRSAELTKYAANAMLATRISFINEMAQLCEAVGADINDVREGIGSDSRIGSSFLYPGAGYGGSCFPKDVEALRHTFEQHNLNAGILKAVEERNARQKQWAFGKIARHFGGVERDSTKLEGRHFALWGLSFKPDTDDVREAPSLVLIEQLLEVGATVSAYCPKGCEQTNFYLQNKSTLNATQLGRLRYVESAYQAAEAADALILLTEWREFLSPDWQRLKKLLKCPLLFDGRTQFSPRHLARMGFQYYAVGLPTA
ncbi:UDP-glucose/GDP-mannose dehydrogenase family protein [Candidatus Haliotispira prima]|uniref:UDP-glucose 6-dehydrogenase n=1 Tax=Candidatus Haliotispira prima TaxID=3034016 RepID=A0ABY8MJ25_9SPIO|nr:UDP-glucose/GDP-mannose dehydrogenase family protein [Candidatus Haliotispira prima]